MSEKIDFKKTMPGYRARRGRIDVLDLPELQYLMIDGAGDPNTAPEYSAALQTLYPVAYALKFLSKQDLGRDYVVPPLEGLWWADDMAAFTTARDKNVWHWTVMLMVPEWLDEQHVTEAINRSVAKIPSEQLAGIRFETLTEGRCVQTLHIGPYDDEAPVLADMHERFIPEHGYVMTGRHHEIYLSDPRRTAPEKLRTILRQPVTH